MREKLRSQRRPGRDWAWYDEAEFIRARCLLLVQQLFVDVGWSSMRVVLRLTYVPSSACHGEAVSMSHTVMPLFSKHVTFTLTQ